MKILIMKNSGEGKGTEGIEEIEEKTEVIT